MARRQIALLPSSVFVLPFALEARDNSRGKVGRVLAEQGGEGLLEVAGGNPAQIENGQKGVEALGAPRPFGQDVRREPYPRARRRASITSLRFLHFDRADSGLDRANRIMAVANQPSAAIRKHEFRGRGQKCLELRLDRLGNLQPRAPVRRISVSGSSIAPFCRRATIVLARQDGFEAFHDKVPSRSLDRRDAGVQRLGDPAVAPSLAGLRHVRFQKDASFRQQMRGALAPADKVGEPGALLFALLGGRFHQGQERDPHGSGSWRAQTQFRGAAFLGPGILRQHGRARRGSHPRLHPQSREGRSEAGADEPLALTRRLGRLQIQGAASATPSVASSGSNP